MLCISAGRTTHFLEYYPFPVILFQLNIGQQSSSIAILRYLFKTKIRLVPKAGLAQSIYLENSKADAFFQIDC